MATQVARDIHAALRESADPVIESLDPTDTKVVWPGRSRQVWPQADISGKLASGEIFIVEIDDQADPGRSFAKYWPVLYAVSRGEHEHPPIRFFEISSPDSICGIGYELLAQFIGERFQEMYPGMFSYGYTSLKGKDAKVLAQEILAFLKESVL